MSVLQITLLGNIRITRDNWQSEVKLTRSLQALLAYLLLNRDRMISRDVLAGVFWSELTQRRARNSLNTALWRLRDLLEPRGFQRETYLISNQSGDLGINHASRLWLDIAVFEEKANHILALPFHSLKESNVQELEHILQLYKGDLLEGFYDDWVLIEREQLRAIYMNCLRYLMNYEKQRGLCEKGLSHGQQLLGLEPLQEDVHREMMQFYLMNGQRPLAVRQYKICCEVLAEELDLHPMRETQDLYNKIVANEISECVPTGVSDRTNLEQALHQLNQAEEAIELARMQIQEAVGQLDIHLRTD